jgi:hypothetical protein
MQVNGEHRGARRLYTKIHKSLRYDRSNLQEEVRTMDNGRTEVVVVDVKIPFGSMVVLLVKWAVAAIPAAIILIVLGWAVSFALGLLPHFGAKGTI